MVLGEKITQGLASVRKRTTNDSQKKTSSNEAEDVSETFSEDRWMKDAYGETLCSAENVVAEYEEEPEVPRKEEEGKEGDQTALRDYAIELENKMLIEDILRAEGEKFKIIKESRKAAKECHEVEEEKVSVNEEEETEGSDMFHTECDADQQEEEQVLLNRRGEIKTSLPFRLENIIQRNILEDSEEEENEYESTEEKDTEEESGDSNEELEEEEDYYETDESVTDEEEGKETNEDKNNNIYEERNENDREVVGNNLYKIGPLKLEDLFFKRPTIKNKDTELNRTVSDDDDSDKENHDPRVKPYYLLPYNYKDDSERLLFYDRSGKAIGYFDTSSTIHLFHLDILPMIERAPYYQELANRDWMFVLSENIELLLFHDLSGRHHYYVKPKSVRVSFYNEQLNESQNDNQRKYKIDNNLKENKHTDTLSMMKDRYSVIESKLARLEHILECFDHSYGYFERKIDNFQYVFDEIGYRMEDMERKFSRCSFKLEAFRNNLRNFKELFIDSLTWLEKAGQAGNNGDCQLDSTFVTTQEHYATQYQDKYCPFYHAY